MNVNSLNLALRQTARELSVPQKEVEAVYRSYWLFIKSYLGELHLGGMTEEELNAETTNFNIPFIGKLYAKWDKVRKYNNQQKFYQNVRNKKNQANRLSGVSDQESV